MMRVFMNLKSDRTFWSIEPSYNDCGIDLIFARNKEITEVPAH